MSDSEEINMDIDNTKTRDELTFIELLAEHVFDPSSITETSEDVNILELSEEPSLVHNYSLMEVEPATESVEVEEEKTEPVTEPIVEVEEEKTEPIVEVEEEKTEPIVEVKEEKTEPIVEVEEKKTEPVTEPIVEVEEEKTEPIVEVEEQKVEPVKVEEVKVDETPIIEEPKGVFNKISSSIFSICNWFVKK
jgi:hypothetical protein